MIDKVLLFPYYWHLKIRDSFYKSRLARVRTSEVPTICVGNVTVGGTGKTPHVEMILGMLSQSDVWGSKNLAVLSRGYKRESRGFQQVTREGSAAMFGDEPLQIKKKFPSVTVAVDKDRVEGCNLLVHPDRIRKKRRARKCWNTNFPPSDIIVLDDGYQYRRLKADLNVVLVNYNRPVTKDMLLPLGRLRDLPERIDDADIVIVTKCPSDLDNWDKTNFAYSLGWSEFHTSTCKGVNRHGKEQTLLFTTVRYEACKGVYSTADPRYFYSKKLVLMTGIAGDGPLKSYLSDYYKVFRTFSFPDHHKYAWGDFQKILSVVRRHPTAAVATTEKDAQRILDYVGMPSVLMERMFYIPIYAEFLSDMEKMVFAGALDSLRR